MQQTILFKVPGKSSNRPLVILNALAIERQYSTNHFREAAKMLSRALSAAWTRTRCNCTPRRIFRALFSARVSAAVAILVVIAMWWHSMTIADTLEAQRAVGLDCLAGLPWGLLWTVRATRMPEEGGEK